MSRQTVGARARQLYARLVGTPTESSGSAPCSASSGTTEGAPSSAAGAGSASGTRGAEQWQRHGLPERLDGRSFLDVGCWEGFICAEAVQRGASPVIGIDYCTSPDLADTMARYGFAFIQMDLLSEKALQLPEFDVVHCAGVLYHVENPLSLLFRLRKLCRFGGTLHLETSYAVGPSEQPVMVFHPGSSLDDNPSNWWSPNEACLREMLAVIGLSELEITFRTTPKRRSEYTMGRIGIRGRVANTPADISQKMLPRRPSLMPLASARGNRSGGQP
jgi:tRNA (mo5U34)-methyltransferase